MDSLLALVNSVVHLKSEKISFKFIVSLILSCILLCKKWSVVA